MAAQDLEIKFDPGESFIVTFFRPEVTQKIPELPHATPHVTPHVLSETEMRMLRFCEKAKPRSAIIDFIQMNPDYIRKEVIPRLIDEEFLSLTIPHKPRSPYQKYVLTEAGRKCLEKTRK